jgi:hypothetical protein
VERNPDGQMTGSQCLASAAALFDVAGQIRETLITLQAQARAATSQPTPAEGRKRDRAPEPMRGSQGADAPRSTKTGRSPQARPRAGASAPSQAADAARSN